MSVSNFSALQTVQRKKTRTILLFLFVFLSSNIVFSQVNIKVGYTLGYFNPKIINNTITQWNDERPWLEENMKEMHFSNGLQLGLRQRLGPVGVEFTWHSRFSNFNATGTDPATDQRFDRDVFFRYNSYSLGFENYIGNFGYGASIDGSTARFRTERTGRGDRYGLGKSVFGLSSHFHLSLNIESNDILTLSLKPYVQVPWSKLNVFPLQEELRPNDTVNPDDFKEDYLNFGIMLVFYNGNWD